MANEKRLIDANKVLDKQMTAGLSDASGSYYGYADVVLVDDIKKAPTVDAVEVVRCKDCKHYHQYHVGKSNELCEWGKCQLISMDVDMPENGFCPYGERRTDDG